MNVFTQDAVDVYDGKARHGWFALPEVTTGIMLVSQGGVINRPTCKAGYNYQPSYIEALRSVRSLVNRKGFNVFVLTYPFIQGSLSVFKEFQGYVWPSMHAHAGEIFVSSVKFKYDFMEKEYANRMLTANSYKTYFPFHRRIYSVRDPFPAPTVVLSHRTKKTLGTFLVEIGADLDVDNGPIEPPGKLFEWVQANEEKYEKANLRPKIKLYVAPVDEVTKEEVKPSGFVGEVDDDPGEVPYNSDDVAENVL